MPGPKPRPVRERFESKYEVDASGCWLWTAVKDLRGYGKLSLAGGMALAHRVSYELHVGPIPDGLTLDHLCRVRHCVNPAHRASDARRERSARISAPDALQAGPSVRRGKHLRRSKRLPRVPRVSSALGR